MSVNATVGLEGIFLTLLVFGAMPKLPLLDSLLSAVPQGERMKMMETAREEYLQIVAKIRMKQAEKAFIPKTPSTSLRYGDNVLVYREESDRWEPRMFISRNENVIQVLEPNRDILPYSIQK
eukprot:IDg6096t1